MVTKLKETSEGTIYGFMMTMNLTRRLIVE